MTNKNKPLPYIDAQTTSNAPQPVVRKVKFNPYTGGIISTGTDRPNFGKYTMELRSGPKYVSKPVSFRKNFAAGKWTTVDTQLPIPQVKLLVKNPNYDIVNSIVYLALTEDALQDVDNGGNADIVSRQATPSDYYVSFTPSVGGPIIKNTVTMELYDEIVRLFQKYTIYDFLGLVTGKRYADVTDDNRLIAILRGNLGNLNLYAEAGFNNDSDSTLDGYFIRNRLVTRFNFDASYLDNPELKSIILRADATNIYVDAKCSNLQSITFKLFAGPDTDFDYSTDTELIKTYSVDITGKTNPTITIPISDIKQPEYNNLDGFKTESYLDSILFARKCISVKVTQVKVSYGTIKLESEFLDFFGINSETATTKTLTFTSNVIAPLNVTFANTAPPSGRPPYFLNLISNLRKFYLRIEQPGTSPLPAAPTNIIGFLIKYVNAANSATNAIRFFSLDSSDVKLIQPAFIPPGLSNVHYYYEITDFFVKSGSSVANTFKLDIPYASSYKIYLVDKYYNVSTTPLTLSQGAPIDIQNYFTPGKTSAFILQSNFNLVPSNTFLVDNLRISLQFTVEYAPKKVTESTIPPGTKWSSFNSGAKYKYVYNHTYLSTQDYKAAGVALTDSTDKVLTGIDLSSLFTKAPVGQGYWIRLVISPTYTTTQTLPYVNSVLGIFSKHK